MKKGQWIIDFLMEYGWAILVVLIAIGALAYFGILTPDKFIPKCVCDGCYISFIENEEIQYNIINCCYNAYRNNETKKCEYKYQKSYLPIVENELVLEDYCIEWEGWIDRDNMIYNCYDFETQEIKCGFNIDKDYKLWIYDVDTFEATIYNCSRYMISMEVN